MAKMQKKAHKQVVSIGAYRRARTTDIDRLTSQILVDPRYVDFTWKDWTTLRAQLKAEISHFDRAILALTKLAMSRDQQILNHMDAPERRQGRR